MLFILNESSQPPNNLRVERYQRCNPYTDFWKSCVPREITVRKVKEEIIKKEKV